MTDSAVLHRCPRCRSHDTAVLVIEHWDRGDRIVLRCDGCGASFQSWLPREETRP